MKRRAARWTVVLALVAAAGAATHQAVARSRSIDVARDRIAAIHAEAARADLALQEIAASERGYVAPGQGLDFWAGKVDEALASARTALTTLRSTAVDSSAAARIDSALSRLDDFSAMEQRARDYAREGQRTLASDLIFADGYEIVAAARTDAASAAAIEQAAASAPLARERQLHLASIAALAVCAGLASLLLLRGPKQPEAAAGAATPLFAPEPAVARSVQTDDGIGAALDASLDGLETFAQPAPAAGHSVNLDEAADVCVDLARLLDARDLPAVLARIASVLGAEGLIVWMTDASGQALAPALTHGYPPTLISRLGLLPVDADNATASAWRAKSAQVVEGHLNRAGALAVPLLTSDGCIGVLAAELRNGREHDVAIQSLARIIAAQLAASVSPAEAESDRAAEA